MCTTYYYNSHSLLCIAGKILTRILLNRLSLHLADNVLPEIFAARQAQEKCREQNLDLYMVFVDLTKAFDTISRDGLWQILRKIGCPDLFVDIIQSFHEGMVARVQDQGQTSEPFSVTIIPSKAVWWSTVIHISIFSHAQWCVPWQWLMSTHSVPNWWKCI